MLLGAFDWLADFFKALFNLIPKIIYLLYASLACLVDVFQMVFRKLAGLDVYYVDGEPVAGDIVYGFITGILGINAQGVEYPILSTVFWSFMVFGLIMLFMTTIVAIVKSHYSYDDKAAKGPMQYVYTAGKAVINMVAAPIIIVLGLYLSQAILTALDNITSISSSSVVALYGDKVSLLESVRTRASATTDDEGNLEEASSDEKTYIYYDIFGFSAGVTYGKEVDHWYADHKDSALVGATNQTFSGSLFRVAAYNANRARINNWWSNDVNYTGKAGTDYELFANASSDENLAEMIDTAFACALHAKDGKSFELDYKDEVLANETSLDYFTNFLTTKASAFSKFNVGLVWYYYDLWNFNFVVGFASVVVCAMLFVNIIMGLISRLIMMIGLFLIAPPLFGLAPLDGGKAGGEWRKNFMQQTLMAYGAVLGMNIFFLIMPYLNTINFFNIPIADYLMQTLIILVGLVTIKAFIGMVSGLIGGADAQSTGKDIATEVGGAALTGATMTLGAGKVAFGLGKGAVNLGIGAGRKVQQGVHKIGEHRNQKKLGVSEDYEKKENVIQALARKDLTSWKKDDVYQMASDQGLSRRDARQLWRQTQRTIKSGNNPTDGKKDFMGRTNYKQRADTLRAGLAERDKGYRAERQIYESSKNNIEYGRQRAARRAILKQNISDHQTSGAAARAAGNARLKRAGGDAIKSLGPKGYLGMVKDTLTSNNLFSKYGEDVKKKKEKAEAKAAQEAEEKRHKEEKEARDATLDVLGEIRDKL